jgi:dihydroorotate dehydrogenase (fumarate)
MTDLTTTYLGLALKNPLVAAASPLSKQVDTVRRLEDAGVAAVVVYSLFEEQITHESMALNEFLVRGTDTMAEALSIFPDLGHYNLGPEEYLEHLRRLKEAVDIPVIASLNGTSAGGWVDYALKMQQAGADALELNMYYLPTDPDLDSTALERNYLALVGLIRPTLRIPLAVKLSPFFTALPNFAQRLTGAGANGLVLFNRFYQPELDVESLAVVPNLVLSTSEDLRLPLRWIAILYGRIQADFAASSGIRTTTDAIKAVMAGAKAAMMASELLENGVERPREMLAEMDQWLQEHEYESVAQMCGSMSQQAVAEPAAFERANYMKALTSFDKRLP